MTTVDRRHFLMSSVALPAALKASRCRVPTTRSAWPSSDFNGRGKAHISAYLKMPNVEIAALCDVDQSVVDSGCKTIEAAGKKRPATYADFRKLLDDKSIDACRSRPRTPPHTADDLGGPGGQGRPGREAGLLQHVRSPEDRRGGAEVQPHRAGRHRPQAWLHEAKQKIKHGVIGDVYMARGLVFKWRDTIGRAKEEPAPPGVDYDLWPGPAPVRRLPAIGFTTTGTGSGTTAMATSATRACTRWTWPARRSA